MTSLIKGEWKLLHGQGKTSLYNIANDFGETRNLAGNNALLLESLLAEMTQYVESQELLAKELRKGKEEEGAVQIDARTIEQLEALGYLK